MYTTAVRSDSPFFQMAKEATLGSEEMYYKKTLVIEDTLDKDVRSERRETRRGECAKENKATPCRKGVPATRSALRQMCRVSFKHRW